MTSDFFGWDAYYECSLRSALGIRYGIDDGAVDLPTAKVVLQSMLAIILPAVAAIAGIQYFGAKTTTEESDKEPSQPALSIVNRLQIDLVPLAVLCAFLAFGSCLGIFVRTNALLGSSETIELWRHKGVAETATATKTTQQDTKAVSKTVEAAASAHATDATLPVLFDSQAPSDTCAELGNAPADPAQA